MDSIANLSDINTITEQYSRQGYFLPLRVISSNAAHELRTDLEDAERSVSGEPEKTKMLRQYPHPLLPSFDALIQTPALIDVMTGLIGSDLLVWGCSLFVKEPGTHRIVSWHQDLTYWGLDDAREVTAWVALSPSTEESGAMRYIPRTHRQSIVKHIDTFDENNMLSRGQEIAVDVDELQAVSVILDPGQAALHHGRLFHASGPNLSSDRRIGVAIRYIDAAMKQIDGQKPMARCVAGRDQHGHFSLTSAPAGRLSDKDFARCREDISVRESFLYKTTRKSEPAL